MTYKPSQEAYNQIVTYLEEGNKMSAVGFVMFDGKMEGKKAMKWVEEFNTLHFTPIWGKE